MVNYDQLAADYARHRTIHPEVLKILLEKGRLTPESRILEVGCGTGNYITAIAAHSEADCWGIEPSEQMLAHARSRSQTIHFQQGTLPEGQFPADFFDRVFSVDVIHHVTEHPTFFQEAYRILKPGGQLCTVTDSEWIIRHRQPLATHFPETVEPELQRYPRIPALREWMEQVGFSAITEDQVEFAYTTDDIQIYRDKAYSTLHRITEDAFQRGIARLEADLQAGPIPCVSRYVLLWGAK